MIVFQSEICCCNKDSCNDTPYKTGVEQVPAGTAGSIGSPGSAGSEPEPKGKPTTGATGKTGNGASITSASIGVLAIALARVFA